MTETETRCLVCDATSDAVAVFPVQDTERLQEMVPDSEFDLNFVDEAVAETVLVAVVVTDLVTSKDSDLLCCAVLKLSDAVAWTVGLTPRRLIVFEPLEMLTVSERVR